MFSPGVVKLREFYASDAGHMAAQAVSRAILSFWPEGKGETVLGLGYPTPFLHVLGDASLTVALMPAAQGAAYWPTGRLNLAVLGDETSLPVPDNQVNRVLAVHMLENTEQVRRNLEEVWRVLTPGGRLLAIVPNRRGIWARSPASPFAYGQPFTGGQLRDLLADAGFTVVRAQTALYPPPNPSRFMQRIARIFERSCGNLFPGFGGVLLMEAEKQIYATTREVVTTARQRKLVAQPAGALPV